MVKKLLLPFLILKKLKNILREISMELLNYNYMNELFLFTHNYLIDYLILGFIGFLIIWLKT